MALEITNPAFGHFIPSPGQRKEMYDKTADATFEKLGVPCRWALVQVYMKSFTAGNGSAKPIFVVKAGSDSNTSADVIFSEAKSLPREDGVSCLFLVPMPLIALSYVAIDITMDGTDSCIYDAVLVGV